MPKAARGFTLIEVIIAITVMSFIAVFTAGAIQKATRDRRKVQANIDSRSGINAALQLMTNDIRQAFNFRDYNAELYNASQKKRLERFNKGPAGGGTAGTGGVGGTGSTGGVGGGGSGGTGTGTTGGPTNPDNFKLRDVKTYTRFLGESDRIDFTTLDPNRPTENAKISDQVEVGYRLEPCTSAFNKNAAGECLWRRHTSYIDDNIKEGGKESVVLENIKSLTFRYLGPGHEEKWTESWRSEGGEEVMKNNFPHAVEITLVVYDTQHKPPKEIGMTVVAPIVFTNNKEVPKIK